MALATHAVLHVRSSQGAIAWVLSLVFMPLVGVPLYLIFGQGRFSGYVQARQDDSREFDRTLPDGTQQDLARYAARPPQRNATLKSLEQLAEMPMTRGNQVKLLIDGEQTFAAIFSAIDQAQDYVLVQSFIIKNDGLGKRLKQKLLARLQQGVRVFLLYDAVGSYNLSAAWRQELQSAGAVVHPFRSTLGRQRRLQVNFRNHRKIVVVDGKTGFVGGHNVGDEYLGKSARFGAWRDTHVRVVGPATLELQQVFLDDWYWACHQLPLLDWQVDEPPCAGQHLLVAPTGPAEVLASGSQLFLQLIYAANSRIWIASPYFVPSRAILESLQAAALRGVDVRLLLPSKPDKFLPWLAAYAFLQEAARAGVRCFRFTPGFLHQKVVLVDDDLSVVGTANCDNRSFHLNFEVSLLTADEGFAGEVAEMLENDFSRSRELGLAELERMSWLKKVGVNLARLWAPLL